jgi:hypothetical protein
MKRRASRRRNAGYRVTSSKENSQTQTVRCRGDLAREVIAWSKVKKAGRRGRRAFYYHPEDMVVNLNMQLQAASASKLEVEEFDRVTLAENGLFSPLICPNLRSRRNLVV